MVVICTGASIFQVNASKLRSPLDTVDLEELPDSCERTGTRVLCLSCGGQTDVWELFSDNSYSSAILNPQGLMVAAPVDQSKKKAVVLQEIENVSSEKACFFLSEGLCILFQGRCFFLQGFVFFLQRVVCFCLHVFCFFVRGLCVFFCNVFFPFPWVCVFCKTFFFCKGLSFVFDIFFFARSCFYLHWVIFCCKGLRFFLSKGCVLLATVRVFSSCKGLCLFIERTCIFSCKKVVCLSCKGLCFFFLQWVVFFFPTCCVPFVSKGFFSFSFQMVLFSYFLGVFSSQVVVFFFFQGVVVFLKEVAFLEGCTGLCFSCFRAVLCFFVPGVVHFF